MFYPSNPLVILYYIHTKHIRMHYLIKHTTNYVIPIPSLWECSRSVRRPEAFSRSISAALSPSCASSHNRPADTLTMLSTLLYRNWKWRMEWKPECKTIHSYLNYYRYALIWSDDMSILRIPGQYVEGSYSSLNDLVHVHSILHTDVQ